MHLWATVSSEWCRFRRHTEGAARPNRKGGHAPGNALGTIPAPLLGADATERSVTARSIRSSLLDENSPSIGCSIRDRFRTCAKIDLGHPSDDAVVTRDESSQKTRWFRILAVLGITVVFVLTVPAILSVQGTVEPTATSGSLTATGPPEVTDYAVTFVESGLPAGTSWNVSIDGTLLSSTSADIVFHEPDGSYLFSVGEISGYITNPEGNVTVNGGPVTMPILFVATSTGSQGCTSYNWQGDNYTLHGDCRGFFEVDLRSSNATSGYTFENSTFDVGAIAEVDGAGNLVALLVMNHESTGNISVVSRTNEVNLTDNITANVTSVIGLNASSGSPDGQLPNWSPNEALGSVGPTIWGSGSQVLGSVDAQIVFHFLAGSQGSNRVKFDVAISGWPWVNPADSLGLEIGATAAQQTYFAYTAANGTIAQRWISNGTVASRLVFGTSANATVGDANSGLVVTNQVGLYPSGTAPDIAFALLLFQGTGGYSALTYDPWIVFGPTPAVVVPPPVISTPSTGASLPLLAVAGIVLATALLGVVAYRLRRRRVDEGLRPAWQGEPALWL